MKIKKAIETLIKGKDLSEKDTYTVFKDIMSGKATPAQIGSFITALRMKGETVAEITGAAKVMREKARKIKVHARSSSKREVILDTCGTGGSGLDTFNVSTAVAFILAAKGIKVAKHGNRAVSGKCGSADVLEALGAKIDVSVKTAEKCIKEVNVGFLFAPLFHGAMKYAAQPRREIGVRTIFNILGPLSNPAGATHQVLGVYDEKLTPVVAGVLKRLGTKRAYVVSGKDSLDEITISTRTRISELKNGRISSYYVSPADFGMKKTDISRIKGGNAGRNARIMKEIFSGEKGPRRDIVLMNSSIAFIAAGAAKGYREGVKIAADMIDNGKAMDVLNRFIEITRT